jgi:nucleotide-binding universal stress UspA family protein
METVQKKKKIICQQVKSDLERIASTIVLDEISVSTEACEGPVVEAILEAADRLEIDLIAMAAYGEKGAIPGMIGSVADRVLHEAYVPVMLFRPAHSSERETIPLLTLA